MNKIYLDNAATTRVDGKVIQAMTPYLDEIYGNPSSIHSFGQEAKSAVDESREKIANFLNCKPEEIIFTSGGSESDNLAIRGLVESSKFKAQSKPHVITSAIEHHAVLHTIQDLEKEGLIEASYIKPRGDGAIRAKDIIDAIKANTLLISIMYVNNETGVIQPIQEIGKILKQVQDDNIKNRSEAKWHIYFHTDAVQAAEYLNIDVEELGVDLLTLTAHKIHGPKGIGVLFAKKGVPFRPMITGGAQEMRLRAGTENVASIAGFAKAIEQAKSEKRKAKSIEILRDKLQSGILKLIPDVIVNGAAQRAPHILNVSFLNAEGEAIILNLDFLGIAVSSGSACTSRSLDPSHVLSAMGTPPEKAHGSIRFSLSKYTTEQEIDKVLEVLPGIITKLRAMSPFKN